MTKVLVITGGPGVGKTTLVNSILRMAASEIGCLLAAGSHDRDSTIVSTPPPVARLRAMRLTKTIDHRVVRARSHDGAAQEVDGGNIAARGPKAVSGPLLSAAVRALRQSAPSLRVLDHAPRTDSQSFVSPSHTTKSNRPRRPSSESPTRKTNLRSNKLSRPFSASSGKYNWVVRMRPPGFWTLT
jgi:hypothetical protein